MFKGFAELVLVVVIIGALLGFALSRTELLNPSFAAEQARRMSAERSALEAKTAYEQQQYQIDLERRQALAEIDQRWRERWAETIEYAVSFLVLGLTVAIVAVGFGGGACLACLGIDRLRPRPIPSPLTQQQGAKVIPLPARRSAPDAGTPGVKRVPEPA